MGDVLELRVRKRFADFQLDMSANFPPGIMVVFGPSGSGKTTLLNCIAGLDKPEEGEIVLNGRPLFSSSKGVNLPPERRRIGYMFQESLLFPHLSVADNIGFGYKLTPLELRRIHPNQLVELLELGPLIERKPESLSSGERQRVVLARALATSPDLLLLDEPLSSLHMSIKGRILRYLKALHRELSIPMVYVSHSISEVLALGHKALIVNGGKQVAFDEPRKVLSQPGAAPAMDVESLENLFDVELVEQRPDSGITLARLDGATIALPLVEGETGKVISIAIRAADIIIASERPQGISARNILAARVEELNQVGNQVLVHADAGRSWVAEVTPDAVSALGLREGQEVYLVVKSSSITPLG